jgi:hypothetical protein
MINMIRWQNILVAAMLAEMAWLLIAVGLDWPWRPLVIALGCTFTAILCVSVFGSVNGDGF